jgi:hypothetical protein
MATQQPQRDGNSSPPDKCNLSDVLRAFGLAPAAPAGAGGGALVAAAPAAAAAAVRGRGSGVAASQSGSALLVPAVKPAAGPTPVDVCNRALMALFTGADNGRDARKQGMDAVDDRLCEVRSFFLFPQGGAEGLGFFSLPRPPKIQALTHTLLPNARTPQRRKPTKKHRWR